MKSRSIFFLLFVVFLLGAALPVALVWNPAGWEWADQLTARIRGQAATPTEGAAPGAGGEPGKKERKIKYWQAPMNPSYVADKPGKSPMGMDLVPIYEDENETPAETGVRVSTNFLQNFAVRTEVVKKGSIPVDIRTIGILIYNERDIASINTKFEGWIEKAYVNYVGEPVKKGQVLFEIYSPELVTTQDEFLTAVTYVKRLTAGGTKESIQRARSLLESARERLHYWDITDGQINALQRGGKITRTLKIVSPVSGLLIEKMSKSLEGMKVNPGTNIYKIADLSTIWVQIEVYEYQLKYVRLGQPVRITVDAYPGRRWVGKVIYLDPTINQRTRTLKVYVQLPNPGLKLRPDMYANVNIPVPNVAGVVIIPDEAILHTGERNVVIVRKGERLFDPREVKLGAVGNGYQEVRHGLKAGEVVVTSSQFLIASESNLKEAINKMLASKKAKAEEAEAPAKQHEEGAAPAATSPAHQQ